MKDYTDIKAKLKMKEEELRKAYRDLEMMDRYSKETTTNLSTIDNSNISMRITDHKRSLTHHWDSKYA